MRLDRVRPRAVGRREAQLDLVRRRPLADLACPCGGQVVEDHVDPVAVVASGPDRLQRLQALAAGLAVRRHPTGRRRRSSSSRGTAGPRGACGSSPADVAARSSAPTPTRRPGGWPTARTRRTRTSGPGVVLEHLLDAVELGVPIGVVGLLPRLGPLERDVVVGQDLTEPFPTDLHHPVVVVAEVARRACGSTSG